MASIITEPDKAAAIAGLASGKTPPPFVGRPQINYAFLTVGAGGTYASADYGTWDKNRSTTRTVLDPAKVTHLTDDEKLTVITVFSELSRGLGVEFRDVTSGGGVPDIRLGKAAFGDAAAGVNFRAQVNSRYIDDVFLNANLFSHFLNGPDKQEGLRRRNRGLLPRP